MKTQQTQRLEACIQEIAEILYQNTPAEDLTTLEGIEQAVRGHMLKEVSPRVGFFFVKTSTGTTQGKTRTLKSCIGELKLNAQQLQRLGVNARRRVSPFFETCCLRVCANESYAHAEEDLKLLLGMDAAHSSLQRCVARQDLSLPEPKEIIQSLSLDGGKVRLRSPQIGAASYWRDYKAACLNEHDVGAYYHDKLSLSDWVNAQPLDDPLVCLGDGHPGIWKLFEAIAAPEQRLEILDWYHLKENLFKVGGSLKRILQAEALLWHGNLEAVLDVFKDSPLRPAQNFCAYLNDHAARIVNYAYFQAMTLMPIPIGSGSVESAVKPIDQRLQLTGAQWNPGNVNQMLALRCNYLSGSFNSS
ncbi:MAG: ISKra4 family transposase [Thermosynechococcaceae cyanobacterium]